MREEVVGGDGRMKNLQATMIPGDKISDPFVFIWRQLPLDSFGWLPFTSNGLPRKDSENKNCPVIFFFPLPEICDIVKIKNCVRLRPGMGRLLLMSVLPETADFWSALTDGDTVNILLRRTLYGQ